MARRLTSSKLPIGVATTYRTPSELIAKYLFGLLLVALTGCNGVNLDPKLPANLPEDSNPFDLGHVADNPQLFLTEALSAYTNDDIELSQQLLDELITTENAFRQLKSFEQFQARTLEVELRLISDPFAAIQLAKYIRPINDEQRVRARELLFRVLMANNQLKLALTFYEATLVDSQPSKKHTNRIFDAIVFSNAITSLDVSAFDANSSAQQWLSLARLFRESLSRKSLEVNWQTWRQLHANHIAARYPPDLLTFAEENPKKIAVLLPESGALQQAAAAIRDGLIIAYMSDNASRSPTERNELVFFDTFDREIEKVIDIAKFNGADAIIGPLQKDNVEKVLSLKQDLPRTLLLNRSRASTVGDSTNIKQLSLAIEDEAVFIADGLQRQPKGRYLLFYGNDAWAKRAKNEFLLNVPPNIDIAVVQNISELSTVTEDVGKALLVDASTNRHLQIENLTRSKLEFTVRRRGDVDGVVAFVNETEFESMIAALRFHFADALPVYVTETAIRSGVPPVELNQVKFSANPWSIEESSMRELVEDTFEPSKELSSLYALGVDAYRLINYWSHLNKYKKISGYNGLYTIDNHGRIKRTPIWGAIRQQDLVPFVSESDLTPENFPYL